MQRVSTIFLQAVTVLVGIGVFALMLRFPLTEGRNVDATLFEVYFRDPFLAYAYVASISFFVALYQVYMLLRHIRRNKIFTMHSVRALRNITYCAISLVGFIVLPLVYLLLVRPEDDIAGGVATGFFLILVSFVVAAASSIFERVLRNAMAIKSDPIGKPD